MKTPSLDAAFKFCCFLLFLFLSLIWCQHFFSFNDLNGHVMIDGDPALNAWALNWVSRAFTSDLTNLLNGNVFYPNTGAVALSEHMASLAIFNLPIRLFTDSPWVGYNLIIFTSYLLSAVGSYYFINEISHSRLAALWGGVFWGFLFFRVHHIGHLQILAYQWFPLIALFLLRTCRAPSLSNSLFLATFFILQALTSWYLAVIAGIFVLIIFTVELIAIPWSTKHWLAFIGAALLVAIAIVPFTAAYIQALKESSLSDRLMAISSIGDQVKLLDFFMPPNVTFLGALLPNNKYWIWGENTLFIGWSACLLSLAGLYYGWRENKRLVITALALIIVGYVLSLGYFSTYLGIKLPLYYIAKYLPFIAAIRATPRFALLIYFGILILSSFGITFIASRLKTKLKVLVVGIFCFIFLLEVYPSKLPFTEPSSYQPSPLDSAIAKLSRQENKKLVVLHYPIYTVMPGYPTREAKYMVDSTLHWANILNGFSGAEPLGYKEDMQTLDQIPSVASFQLLNKYGVNILAIHTDLSPEKKLKIKNYFLNSDRAIIEQIDQDQFLIILKAEKW